METEKLQIHLPLSKRAHGIVRLNGFKSLFVWHALMSYINNPASPIVCATQIIPCPSASKID